LIKALVGKEILGVILAPDGSTQDQFHSLLKKAKQWAFNINYYFILEGNTITGMRSTISKSLIYLLGANTF